GSSSHCGLAYLDKKIGLCSRRVLRRKLDILDEGSGALYPLHREPNNFMPGFAQLEFAMDFRSGEKHVYTAALSCRFNGLAGGIDVPRHAARETTNDRPFDFARNRLHRGEV